MQHAEADATGRPPPEPLEELQASTSGPREREYLLHRNINTISGDNPNAHQRHEALQYDYTVHQNITANQNPQLTVPHHLQEQNGKLRKTFSLQRHLAPARNNIGLGAKIS